MIDRSKILMEITSGKVARVTAGTFSTRYPDAYEEMRGWSFPDGFSFHQKVYHYLHCDYGFERGVCPTCGGRCRFVSISKGYTVYCSNRCSGNSVSTKRKRESTCLERYGETNVSKSETIKKRKSDTCNELYGGIGFASSELGKKSRLVCLERYGSENAAKCDIVKDKQKETCKERYGKEYVMQNDEINSRRVGTCNELYGGVGYASDIIFDKVKATCKERYGVEYGTQSETIKEKVKIAWDSKSSDEIDEINKKREETCLEKYGVEHPSQTEEVKMHRWNTSIERYGTEYPSQSEMVKSRIRKTIMERYGVRYTSQCEFVKRKVKDTWSKKSKDELEDIISRRNKTLVDKYGCVYPSEFNQLTHFKISKINIAFGNMLKSDGIDYDMEFGLDRYCYDFKVGNVLIEINPTITHNSFLNVFGGKPRTPDYHLNKSKCASDNGYHCIHVWDWDDWDKIISMLKPKQTLYARKLELREVGKTECADFLNAYHLQGSCKGQVVRLGLYMNDILVELMTFGKPRYNKHYEYELLRLCSHSDYIVVGGAERLFKHFVDAYKPNGIVSYCDASKFDGKVYERLGFGLKTVSSPTKHWYNIKSGQHITDNLLRQRGFDQLFNASYGKGTSNDVLMLEHGFLPICDCGQYSYEYVANQTNINNMKINVV